MSSIFDGITKPSGTLEVVTAGGNTQYGAGSTAPPAPPPLQAVSPQSATAPYGRALPAAEPAAPSTGLLAAVSPEQFQGLVREAGAAVVLFTVIRLGTPTTAERKRGVVSTATNYRYVMAAHGMVFATTAGRPLDFAPEVRVVDCLTVLYDGRPLGREESSL